MVTDYQPMKEVETDSWWTHHQEYLTLAMHYLDLIDNALEGCRVDIAQSLRLRFTASFGLDIPLDEIVRATSKDGFYEEYLEIPSLDGWLGVADAEKFRSWRKEWVKKRKRLLISLPQGQELRKLKRAVIDILKEDCTPIHYKDMGLFHFTPKYQSEFYSINENPVALLACFRELEKEGELQEVCPGVWSLAWGRYGQYFRSWSSRISPLLGEPAEDGLIRKTRTSSTGLGLETQILEIFDLFGFEVARKGKRGEADVVAWDGDCVLIVESKNVSRYPLRSLSLKIGRHVKKVTNDKLHSQKRAFYLLVAWEFQPLPSPRKVGSHRTYISDAEKQAGVPVIPITVRALNELAALSEEAILAPSDIVGILEREMTRLKRRLSSHDIKRVREGLGKKPGYSELLKDLIPLLAANSGKASEWDIIEQINMLYSLRDGLKMPGIKERSKDLRLLLRILGRMRIIELDDNKRVHLKVTNFRFIERSLERLICSKHE